jgi:hypothetical protein
VSLALPGQQLGHGTRTTCKADRRATRTDRVGTGLLAFLAWGLLACSPQRVDSPAGHAVARSAQSSDAQLPTAPATSPRAQLLAAKADCGKDCPALAKPLRGLAQQCAMLRAERGDFGQAYNACTELAAQAPAQASQIAGACKAGDAIACHLHGALLSGRLTALVAHEIISPPCRRKAGIYCSTQLQRRAQIPFASSNRNPDQALQAFEHACKGGVEASCLERLQLLEDRGGSGLRQAQQLACIQHGLTSSCSALVQNDAQTRVFDFKAIRAVEKALRKQCDQGRGLACNALGFGFEANLLRSKNGKPLQQAATHYAKACRLKAATGCANLIVFGLNHRRYARKLPYGPTDAARQVTEGCDIKQEALWPICFAEALALKRGLGTRRQFRTGQRLMRKLCKRRFVHACRN